MNIFRLAGDMTHLISILILLLKIYATKSCSGISRKTQELFALVFLARYMDLFTDFISVYNTIMKIVFIGSSLAIVWCMRFHRAVRRSYDRELDTFRHWILVAVCFLLALLVHEKFTFLEVFWGFSIYLEAVAILPQLVLLQRSGNVDNLTGQYVAFLGAYRAFYILNWIYRYFTEPHFSRWIACVAGLVQTALYADFFYYYFISWKNNVKLQLPAWDNFFCWILPGAENDKEKTVCTRRLTVARDLWIWTLDHNICARMMETCKREKKCSKQFTSAKDFISGLLKC